MYCCRFSALTIFVGSELDSVRRQEIFLLLITDPRIRLNRLGESRPPRGEYPMSYCVVGGQDPEYLIQGIPKETRHGGTT